LGPRKTEPAGLALRIIAAGRLREVLGGSRFSPFNAAEVADPRDRALANRLITTALRRHGHIDIILGELLERGMPKKSGSFESVVRLAIAQLVYLPEVGAHSAPFLAVEAVKRDPKAQHLAGLMNAVLRRAQANSARYFLMPPADAISQATRARWASIHDAATLESFGEALIAGAPLDLTLRDDDPALTEALGAIPVLGDTVRLDGRDRPVDALPGYAEGRWWVQDAAAAIPARLLGLPAGSAVLDLCAAPGGKTAQLVKAGYAVTAVENDPARAVRLRENLDRLGMSATLVEADAIAWRPPVPADGVLLDAPCSATGTFRRHPEVLLRTPDLAGRVALQRTLLASAADSLKPGGVLVYCVCSLEPEEGEAQAAWALSALPLEPMPVTAGDVGGMADAVTIDGTVRIHPALVVPGVEGGTLDGFFVARFRKLPALE
jgi:16S rRNA (cytosine967-C5)-methyltransferase